MVYFQTLVDYCKEKGYKYELGANWCDCTDYTDFMNITAPNFRITVYMHTNGQFSCNYYIGKDFIRSWVNFDTAEELIELVEREEI